MRQQYTIAFFERMNEIEQGHLRFRDIHGRVMETTVFNVIDAKRNGVVLVYVFENAV